MCIANANSKQILADVDCVIIAAIAPFAKLAIAYTKYTICNKN